jgi:tetratricopeptide (TPR) repeat protein
MRRILITSLLAAALFGSTRGADPAKPDDKKDLPPGAATSDVELVEKNLAARKEYENSLKRLWEHYKRAGDKQRVKWVEDELMAFHLVTKPSYNLDVQDVPPPTLEAKTNIREANDLYKAAMEYKGRGIGSEYVLNMRRAEMYFREVLEKHPTSDKIPDTAYQLAELYEGRAYKQYDRAARYFERSYQWKKGTATDARLRAATLYDRMLNERSKAVQLYKEVVEHDTDPDRIKVAEKRLSELSGPKK